MEGVKNMKTLLKTIIIMLITTSANAALIADWYYLTGNAFTGREGSTGWMYSAALYIYGGSNTTAPTYKDDVYRTYDGVDWTLLTGNANTDNGREKMGGLYFNGKMYFIGGGGTSPSYHNDIWSSTNGTDWTAVTRNAEFSARENHAVVTFNAKMWVISGVDATGVLNDVWSSTDGIEWTAVTRNAEFGQRHGAKVVVFNSVIYVVGGFNTSSYNDVWSSTDGIEWTAVTRNAEWAARVNHEVFVLNNQIWLTGGKNKIAESGQILYNDVWRSDNGILWTQDSTADFAERSNFVCVTVSANSFAVVGGYGGGTTKFGDVWLAEINLTTATVTQTITPTTWVSATYTATKTVTQTVTPTITITQTATKTITGTVTQTITTYPTLSITPTITPTHTISQTITPTWTPSTTETITPVLTATITQTVTPIYTPELIFTSHSKCNFKDSIKVQWPVYVTDPDPNFIIYLNDYYISVSSGANESLNTGQFVYTIKNLAYNVTYQFSVSATAAAWNLDNISNIVSVKLYATPTPVP